jgi:putative transposase
MDNHDHRFFEVSRFVHLNPVRARLVARPEQYPWSSYGGYQRASRTVAWVTHERVLGELGAAAGQDLTPSLL